MAWPDPSHLPFPLRTLSAGVHPLGRDDLFEGQTAEELAAKVADLDAHAAEAVAWLPGSEAAQAEVAALVGAAEPTLVAAARCVADDLVVLDRPGLVVVAGAVVHPNRWSIHDKLGRPVDQVHAPVPGFAGRLAGQTARLLQGLRPGRGLWRASWAVLDDPALHQPAPTTGMPRTFDPDALWLRVERQALWPLPVTGGVLFTIRTRQWPLASLAAVPDQLAGLAEAVRTTPDELGAYKGIAAIRDDLVAWAEAQPGRIA